jgi:hypothetical protein
LPRDAVTELLYDLEWLRKDKMYFVIKTGKRTARIGGWP